MFLAGFPGDFHPAIVVISEVNPFLAGSWLI
jgi:hypothetical protein